MGVSDSVNCARAEAILPQEGNGVVSVTDVNVTPLVGGARERLEQLSGDFLADRQLTLASNRGPVTYEVEGRELLGRRGVGGVVTALTPLGHYMPLAWISCTMTEGDRRMLRRMGGKPLQSPFEGDENLTLRFIRPSYRQYQQYYNVICNPLLWFLQHNMWNSPYTPNVDKAIINAWENGYLPVNRLFAEAIITEARAASGAPVILLQDYQLYLAGGEIRAALPDALIQHFIHIPWPPPPPLAQLAHASD